MVRLVTWNVNSLRARLQHVERFCREYQPDILCLQETKVRNSDFPLNIVRGWGFAHIEYEGIPSYNGVAVLSKLPLQRTCQPLLGNDDARHVSLYIDDLNLRLDNVYVPAGGDVADPAVNPKFADKLGFMHDLATMANALPERAIILGDINIAPGENDVWSHTQMLRVVSHTPVEIAAYEHLVSMGQLTNLLRQNTPEPTKLHSWWSYRVKQWSPQSRGLLLDHILATPSIAATRPTTFIASETRGWQEKPSDHAAVIVDIT